MSIFPKAASNNNYKAHIFQENLKIMCVFEEKSLEMGMGLSLKLLTPSKLCFNVNFSVQAVFSKYKDV